MALLVRTSITVIFLIATINAFSVDTAIGLLQAKAIRQSAEEKAKKQVALDRQKRLEALAELSGWPKEAGIDGLSSPLRVEIYGTNSDDIVSALSQGCHVYHFADDSNIYLVELCERHFPVVFRKTNKPLLESGISEWEVGRQKGMIEEDSYHEWANWKMYDDSGRLVKWAPPSQFKEYIWMTNQHAIISSKLRCAWAEKHGLTLEQAKKRAEELILASMLLRSSKRQYLEKLYKRRSD